MLVGSRLFGWLNWLALAWWFSRSKRSTAVHLLL
jgi:hypothetical protein